VDAFVTVTFDLVNLNSTGAYYPEKNGLVFRFKKAKSGKPLQMDDKMFALSKVK
jgi:hypothetical protein